MLRPCWLRFHKSSINQLHFPLNWLHNLLFCPFSRSLYVKAYFCYLIAFCKGIKTTTDWSKGHERRPQASSPSTIMYHQRRRALSVFCRNSKKRNWLTKGLLRLFQKSLPAFEHEVFLTSWLIGRLFFGSYLTLKRQAFTCVDKIMTKKVKTIEDLIFYWISLKKKNVRFTENKPDLLLNLMTQSSLSLNVTFSARYCYKSYTKHPIKWVFRKNICILFSNLL